MTYEIAIGTSIEKEVFPDSRCDVYLATMREQLSHLRTIQNNADYDCVRSGIAECRTLRTKIEATRVQLKKPVLDVGRAIDAEAKRLTDLIQGIEQPLQQLKDVEDAARAKAKREKEEIQRQEREAEIRRAFEEEQERLRAEQARMAVELEQLRKERAELARLVPIAEQMPANPDHVEQPPVATGKEPATEESELQEVKDFLRLMRKTPPPNVTNPTPARIVKEVIDFLNAKLSEVDGLLF